MSVSPHGIDECFENEQVRLAAIEENVKPEYDPVFYNIGLTTSCMNSNVFTAVLNVRAFPPKQSR